MKLPNWFGRFRRLLQKEVNRTLSFQLCLTWTLFSSKYLSFQCGSSAATAVFEMDWHIVLDEAVSIATSLERLGLPLSCSFCGHWEGVGESYLVTLAIGTLQLSCHIVAGFLWPLWVLQSMPDFYWSSRWSPQRSIFLSLFIQEVAGLALRFFLLRWYKQIAEEVKSNFPLLLLFSQLAIQKTEPTFFFFGCLLTIALNWKGRNASVFLFVF